MCGKNKCNVYPPECFWFFMRAYEGNVQVIWKHFSKSIHTPDLLDLYYPQNKGRGIFQKTSCLP